jgi:hypothetical protein
MAGLITFMNGMAQLHRRDLLINWEHARQQSELTAIEGLS